MVRILPAACSPLTLANGKQAAARPENLEALFLNLCTAVFTGKFSAAMI